SAAALADQAMRRGEAKKALAILLPLVEAGPPREDVLTRVVQVAEAAGDQAAVIRFRSALVDVFKSKNRIGEAAEGLRTLLKLVPDPAEFRSRLAQLDPSLARGLSREQPVAPSPVETSGPIRRPEMPAPRPAPVEEPLPPAAEEAPSELALEKSAPL